MSENIALLATRDYCEKNFAAKQELGLKQDKLTAGDNITITEDNVISATGGGSSVTPESINELFDTYATWEYARLMSRMTLYYDGNICRTLPNPTPYPTPFTINWEINECAYFPENGFFIPMEIMVPKIVTTEDNVYVGLVPQNAKIGDTFKSLSIITHKPLETAGEHFNVSFVYFNCNDEVIGKYAGPGDDWTGWLDSMKEGNYPPAQLVKKTVDDEEVYEYIGKISTQSTLMPLRSDGLDLQKTTGPTGSPRIIGIDGFHMVLRGHMYPNVPVQMSYRYAYAPYENIIGESTTFISEYDARYMILHDGRGDRNKIATKEYVKKLAIDKLLDTPWDSDYVPYQPDLPVE